ncbi:hypothetical protein SALB1_3064 [Salinisphaera sp. LB1]|nr:hypothetical protein SALB1_3064 [Salinisphaera sp. LB1]
MSTKHHVGRLRPQAVSRQGNAHHHLRVRTHVGLRFANPTYAVDGGGFRAVSSLIELGFRADARVAFLACPRKVTKRKTPGTAPASPCRTRRGAGLSRRSRDATAGVRHEPEAKTHTVRPAEGRIPQLRCGKTLLRLSGRYSDAPANGMRAELGSLWRSSNILRAPAPRAGHPLPLRVSVAAQRVRIQTNGFNLERATASLLVFTPLGAAPSSADRKRKKTAGCLSVSEFPAVPLAVRGGREPMRSIGARQGVVSFGYFHLDKQTKVTRASARNPKLNATHRRFKSHASQTDPVVRTDHRPASAYLHQNVLSRHNRLDMPRRPVRRQIVRRLQIDPELRRRIERFRQQPSRIRRNTPLAANDLVHPLNRSTEMSRQRLLAQPQRLKKFVQQDHAKMRGPSMCRTHVIASRSMIGAGTTNNPLIAT